MKKLICMLLVLVLALSCFAACKNNDAPEATTTPAPSGDPNPDTTPTETDPVGLKYAEGTELRMATGYNSAATGLWFDADTAKDGVTLSDGVTYHTGDLKPTWVEVEKVLGIKLSNMYQGSKSATKEFEYWQDRLNEVDMVSVNLAAANEAGVDGKLVDLAQYLDKMPNFKAYLEANPIVRLSITGDTATGAIYVSPYFDGVNDIERMPLMRTDWVEKLLNGEGEFTAESSKKLAAAVYTPYMPTSGKVAVDVVEADGTTVKTINKDYDAAGNIVQVMNDALAAGDVDGVAAVNMLRKYIDEAYAGYYGTNRADLFIGQNAAWDADELVALLRCVIANSQTLNGTDTIEGIFARENANNQRRVDMYRLAAHLFGVRGLESRNNWLYADSEGKIHDARQEASTYEAMERMYAMTQEGLICSSFVDSKGDKTQDLLKNDLGFMHYDYCQTQTIYNATQLDEGEAYRPVMVPVARWFDGTNADGVYMRFTESWRSVKTDAWAISAAGVAGNEDKLNAALALIDYAYSPEGQILMSYGPEAFRSTETFIFNGEEMPKISEGCYNDLMTLEGGNYTNFARKYLGSTLSFVKSQAFEFQCTNEVGMIGAGYISNAIAAGTIKHPVLSLPENLWYASMPTEFAHTDAESTSINSLTELGNTNFGTGKDQSNIFVDQIVGGYTIDGVTDAASAAKKVATQWGGNAFLFVKQTAFDRQVAYFQSLNG